MTVSVVCVTSLCFSRSRSTGKERDAESGNDYFGARDYTSTMGRFLSPDWATAPVKIPYAHLAESCRSVLKIQRWGTRLSG
jgi:RHS repeat-associated protein